MLSVRVSISIRVYVYAIVSIVQVVKRPKFAQSDMGGRVEEIVLNKGAKGLGFSVAGGVGRRSIMKDYMTHSIDDTEGSHDSLY